MSFIGDFFHGIGNLLTGHSFGHKDTDDQPQAQAPGLESPVVDIPKPAEAAPAETPAPQAGAPGSKPSTKSMTPSFLAAAALPNIAGGPLASNVGGKTLTGQ